MGRSGWSVVCLLAGAALVWADDVYEPSASEDPPVMEYDLGDAPQWEYYGSGIYDEGDEWNPEAQSTTEVNPPSASEIPPLMQIDIEEVAEEQDEVTGCVNYIPGYFQSARDRALSINVWGRVDFRAFNHSSIGINEFLVRYARVNFRGVLGDWGYLVGAKVEGRTSSLWEAWIEYRRWKSVRFRAGQYKEPFSYEQLLQAAWLPFLERALGPTNLTPARDIGLQMYGSGWGDRLSYAVGIFNGDGPNTTDTNTSKEAAGRLLLTPWYTSCNIWVKNLSVGGSFTTAMVNHSLADKVFVTEPDTPFVTFGTAPGTRSVFQRGHLQRWGFETEWMIKWFKFYAEYIWNKRHNIVGVFTAPPPVMVRMRHADMINTSWYAAALVVLTGENEVRNGPIAPCHPLGHCGGWGAWELGFRYDTFHTNDAPFREQIVEGTRAVHSWTAGLNWYPTVHIKMAANVYHAHFKDKLYFFGRPFHSETAYIIAAQFYY
jgi:phosphate-selective porin OprO and OprP